ncbi:serine hydrolase domain-containing protein [Saezia sanguinis]|uniref:serine hydrolase domain-containing protein n=1 Tax=Saezia sanguinis TaxID=1965230 RepID=UPI003059B888
MDCSQWFVRPREKTFSMKKTRLTILLMLLSVVAAGCYWYQGGPLPLNWELRRFAMLWHLDGMMLGIRHPDGRTEHIVIGYHARNGEEKVLPLTENEPMRIASLSKPITAMTIRWMVKKGQLQLDGKLVDLLPQLDYSRDEYYRQITVADLLRHVAGFSARQSGDVVVTDNGLVSCDQAIHKVLERKLDDVPGSQIEYANIGYCFLGKIIESKAGLTYEDAVHAMLQDRGVSAEKLTITGVAATAGAVPFTSREELQGAAPVGGWSADLDTLLAIYALELPHVRQIAVPPLRAAYTQSYYGLGWRIWPQNDGSNQLTHYGAFPPLHYSFALILPDGTIVVAFVEGQLWNYSEAFSALKGILSERL